MAIPSSDLKHKVNVTLSTAVAIFTIGIIFNAGVEYDRISNVQIHQATQDIQIASLQAQLQPINQQLAKQSQLLEDIKAEIIQRR